LYSILHTLNNPEKNIITLEDPIEFDIPGINQSQINEGIDFSFSAGMRAVVRQDPNVIMLGEIRDIPTAQQAIQASLIGTLVLSTFHTFDVPALVTRFTEMGIANAIIAQAVQAVISTRLVRVLCSHCKESYEPDNMDIALLQGYEVKTLFKSKGCDKCKNKGYLGRTGIFEIVYFDRELRESIVDKKPAAFLNDLLKRKRIKSLKDSVIAKVLSGITTTSEARKIIGMDE
jgi:type II secretory ATPase GspE/PulE/Tfp pilus assembly ATPase PilB-like protein